MDHILGHLFNRDRKATRNGVTRTGCAAPSCDWASYSIDGSDPSRAIEEQARQSHWANAHSDEEELAAKYKHLFG